MEQALAINEVLAGLLATIVGWLGFIFVLVVLNKLISKGISLGFVWLIQNIDEEQQKFLIKCLVNKDKTLNQLYETIKSERERM